ncbi:MULTISPECIES: SAM-dependent methyltransferase [Helicobacter]|uniref:SAM-dependent methyltransferase n=1 Tax=Helicobacter TaxID=209 RepID=UPI00262C3195|nr:SAM-dependent methyltransferase [Helicobacter sp. UBA3407]
MKPILDVCCGGRMFYADKENPNVLFCDKRFFETTFKKVGKDEKFSVKPDRIVDFRDLPFKNESFYLVIFDPPHILRGSQKSFMVQKYGKLDKSYREDLAKGFCECMRVLKSNGTLIFKWSEAQIALSEILKCFNQEPLLMQKTSKTSHFCVFYKE